MRGALHFVFLALDVAGILGSDFHLLHHRRNKIRPLLADRCFTWNIQLRVGIPALLQRHQTGVADVGPAQQFGQAVFVFNRLADHALGLGLCQVARIDPDRLQALCFT